MTISIHGNKVYVDGVQVGAEYKNHDIAIHQGQKVKDKHYPSANFVVIPENNN